MHQDVGTFHSLHLKINIFKVCSFGLRRGKRSRHTCTCIFNWPTSTCGEAEEQKAPSSSHVVALFFCLALKRTLQNATAHCESSSSSGVGMQLLFPTAVAELDKPTYTHKKQLLIGLEITFDRRYFLCKLRQNAWHKRTYRRGKKKKSEI